MEFFASLVRQKGSLLTGGSDFHGKTKALIQLGGYPILDSFKKDLRQSVEKISS
jgi:hypothetical protein